MPTQLSEVLLARLVAGLGRKETSRNRAPFIDVYHRWAGLDPKAAHPWCCSGMGWEIEQAARELGIESPFPRTAKAIRVLDLAPPEVLRSNPAPGYLYILAHAKPADLLHQWKTDRYTTNGHIGAVETIGASLEVATEISGNTTDGRGGREGNQWARHRGPPEVSHGGMLMPMIDLDHWADIVRVARARA